MGRSPGQSKPLADASAKSSGVCVSKFFSVSRTFPKRFGVGETHAVAGRRDERELARFLHHVMVVAK
jgi:hypothetical protein